MVPLPPEVIVEGAVMDAGRVVEAIKELLAPQQVKTKEVVLSVSGSSVIIKRIAVSDMSDEELSESIKWEAEQYIPFSIDDVNVDFQKLGPGAQEGQADVLLVAVKKDKINDYVNLVKEAGLEPVVLDVDAFALANMYELNYEQEAGIIALLNIGASVMNINILKDGTSIFTRDITVGGNRYTEALQREFGLTYEDAEKVKRGEAVDGADTEQIAGVMASVTEDIVAETQRSLDFFRSTTGSEQVSRVLVSGGCATDREFHHRSSANGSRSRLKSPIPSKTSRSTRNVLMPLPCRKPGRSRRLRSGLRSGGPGTDDQDKPPSDQEKACQEDNRTPEAADPRVADPGRSSWAACGSTISA